MNEASLEDVQSEVADMKTMPIGTIIAWVNKPEKDSAAATISTYQLAG